MLRPKLRRGVRVRKSTGALLMMLSLSACEENLYTGLSEREANRMVALLRTNSIEATRVFDSETETYAVAGPSDRFAEAIRLLEENGLPGTRYDSLGEIFPAEGMVVSPFEQRTRFIHAMNQELAKSIAQIEGVKEARVHLVIPDEDPIDPGSEKARASVFIYYLDDLWDMTNVPKVKLAVANSVDKLSYENVSIMTFPVKNGRGF